MSKLNFIFLGIISLSPSLWAEGGPNIKTLVFQAQLEKSDSRNFDFTPPKAHHFNVEAPSKVEVLLKGGSSGMAQLEKSPAKVTAHLPIDTKGAVDCKISAQLYLCDDKNTYCVPVQEEFTCAHLNEAKLISIVPGGAPARRKSDQSVEMSNFVLNDSAAAFKTADDQHKMLLIDFFGIWCPPCNVLDETVFNRRDFQALSSQYVFLKMDADKPESFALKSKYNVKGYPTVILANDKGEEVSRIVGSRSQASFLKEMRKARTLQNSSLEKRQALANSGKYPLAALNLAEMYFAQEDFVLAQKYVNLSFGVKDNSRFKKLSLGVQVGILKESAKDPDAKKAAASSVESWLQANPNFVESLEWSDYLGQLADDLKDEALKKRNQALVIKITQGFIDSLKKNPKALDEEEITEADLYSILAEAQEATDLTSSKNNYLLAAKAYEKQITLSGIPMEKERGNNIERAYCLYKAGKIEEAMKLYEHLEEVYPKEFTFFFDHASVLQKLNQKEVALAKAKSALQFSYGDNQLRAAFLVAELEVDLGHKQEALALLNETLEKNPIDKNLKVRTSRYIDKLIKLKSQM